MSRAATVAVVVALGLAAGTARAQAPAVVVDQDLPDELRAPIEAALEGGRVETGSTAIAADETLPRGLVQLGGRLVLEGRVGGDVVAIEADVTVRPGAIVGGRLLVLRGILVGTSMASIEGGARWRRDAPVRVVGGPAGPIEIRHDPADRPFPIELEGLFGLVPRQYNNVDGLAFGVAAGLRRRPGYRHPVLVGGPVFRTERHDVGWDVRLEVAPAPLGGVVIGARTHSITDSAERWHRSDLANTVGSLLFAHDDRVSFEREGYAAWVEAPLGRWATLRLRWCDDDFASLPSARPFALFADDEDWRDNPPIEPGEGRALGLEVAVDRRAEGVLPASGFHLAARYDHWGWGGDFDFDWGEAELLGYRSLGGVHLTGRVLVGGRLGGGDLLAPQFRYRLGGAGTIPGYEPLTEPLSGDRAALVGIRVHVPVGGGPVALVGMADVGDAWRPDEDVDPRPSAGAGVALVGRAYLGAFVAHGFDDGEWQGVLLVRPWWSPGVGSR